MAKKARKLSEPKLPRWYRDADIPLRVIRRFAGAVAERFQPDKIILFDSYAYGTPHAASDVDILGVMAGTKSARSGRNNPSGPAAALPNGHHRSHSEEHEMAPGGRRLLFVRDRV